MARVYYAVDVNLERPAAVKVIDTRFRGNPDYAKRFIDEAKTIATWRHEHIVQVYYADRQDDIYFYAMEFIDGASLGELLDAYVDDGELMPHEDVLRIGRDVASALDYAHQQGVIHRDVKPSNVMISSDDKVILTDFGLALDVEAGSLGEILGTPHYASPEQARRSSDAVPQSDIYSLGVMMYEILTGVVPFDDESATAIAVQHISEEPPPPRSLNPALNQATEDVLLKAIAKEPKDRYPTAQAFMQALDEALQQPGASDDDQKAGGMSSPVMPPAALDKSLPRQSRQLSTMSVAQKLAQQLQHIPQPPQSPSTRKAERTRKHRAEHTRTHKADKTVHRKSGSNRRGLVVLMSVVLLLVIVAGGWFLLDGSDLLNNSLSVADSPTATQIAAVPSATDADDTAQGTPAGSVPAETDTPLPVPTQTATMLPPSATPVPPTSTSAPTLTPLPTSTPAPSLTPIPTSTPLRLATFTPQPATQQPASLPDAGTPVRYPDGRTLELYWNGDSFYVYNTGNDSMRVSPLSFTAIGPNGTRLDRHSFQGSRWTQFWHSIESRQCNGIERGGNSDPLSPSECRGYNARLLPRDGEIFWTGRGGGSAFALLWNDEEIARCRNDANFCAVNVPQ
jgi:serine/threonine protein kinase